MKRCFNCGAENKEDARFCKGCGKSFISAGIYSGSSVIDGKKMMHKYALNNKIISSALLTRIAAAVSAVIAFLSVYGGYLIMKLNIIKNIPAMNAAYHQLIIKMQYVAEGTGIKYISQQLHEFMGYFVWYPLIFVLFILFALSIFSTIYYCFNLQLRLKYKEEYYKKSLDVSRVYRRVLFFCMIAALFFIIIMLICILLTKII